MAAAPPSTETTSLLMPPAASAAAEGPFLRNFSSKRRNLGVEESKGGERGDGAPVGAGAGAVAIELTEEERALQEAARKEVDTPFPFLRYNTDPRLAKFAEPLEKLYNIYLTALKAEGPIQLSNHITKVNFAFFLNKLREKVISMPISDIISTSREESILTLSTEEKAALSAIFYKVYSISRGIPNWPLANYPNSMLPALSTIVGYTDENTLDNRIRLLGATMDGLIKDNISLPGATSPPHTIIETFNDIKRAGQIASAEPAAIANAERARESATRNSLIPDVAYTVARRDYAADDSVFTYIGKYCYPEWRKVNTLKPDSNIIYFNEDPTPQRYYPNVEKNTFRNYIFDGLRLSTWTEMEGVSLHHYIDPVISKQLRSKQVDRNQQIFIIKQDSTNIDNGTVSNTSRLDEVREPTDGLPISDYQYIHVNFSGFTITDPIKTFKRAIIYQGNRLTHFPHPEVLLAIAHGVKDMTPHMRSLFPEWSTKETRQKWVLEALETWNRDIEAMTDPHQKYVQRYLYNDVKPKIDATFTVTELRPRIDANIKRLAANANTTDPNAMFGRVQNFQQSYSSVLAPLKAAGRITELQERNKGKRWYGAAIESKEAYRAKIKSYIARIQQALGGPSAVSTEVDTILKLARAPKPNTRDLYARFDAWRGTLDYSKFLVDLANRIRGVRPAGFFTGAAGYAANIAELVLATQQTGPQVVAGAVLDTTLSNISSGVRALEQDLQMLPSDAQTTEMVREIHEIPSYTKGSMNPREYLVRVFEGLKRAYDKFGTWQKGLQLPTITRSPAVANLSSLRGGRRRTAKTGAKSKGMAHHSKHTRKAQRPPKGGRYDAPHAAQRPPKGGRYDAPHAAQRGGASMPLAYFQDGAQMRGTYTDPTGVGLAGSTGSMARVGISQTGGKRSGTPCGGRQNGGFAPSIMGQMVVNSAYLTPVASYMGYRLMKNSRGHKSGRSAHHSGNRFTSRGPRSTQKKRRGSRRN